MIEILHIVLQEAGGGDLGISKILCKWRVVDTWNWERCFVRGRKNSDLGSSTIFWKGVDGGDLRMGTVFRRAGRRWWLGNWHNVLKGVRVVIVVDIWKSSLMFWAAMFPQDVNLATQMFLRFSFIYHSNVRMVAVWKKTILSYIFSW